MRVRVRVRIRVRVRVELGSLLSLVRGWGPGLGVEGSELGPSSGSG